MSVRERPGGAGRGTAPRPSRGGTSSGGRGVESTGRIAGPAAAGATLALATWLGLAAADRFPLPGWLYHFAWYTTLVGLDAVLARRTGRFPLLGRPRLALSLWLWSVPVWLLFELLNLRVANWYYVLASGDLLVRRASAALAFATVLPAIYLGHRAVEALGWLEDVRGPEFRVDRRLTGGLVGAGVLFLGLALWRPALFFPLIWGATTLLVEPWNWSRDPDRSLLGDLARGTYARPLRLLVAGAGIGVLWELFNAFASTRWIYTVPGIEGGKLFEMPVLGYLGFPVFALDCFVLYRALVNLGTAADGWDGPPAGRGGPPAGEPPAERDEPPAGRRAAGGVGRTGRIAAAVSAVAFSLGVLAAVDRYTVDSHEPRLAELPGVGEVDSHRLAEVGYGDLRALAAAEPAAAARAAGVSEEVARDAVGAAGLARLRGLGTSNAAALAAAGIGDPCALASARPEEVTAAVRRARDDPYAGRPARVRVWIRAAREACRRDRADLSPR